jgi:uncharacterized protein (TIGR03083 family)
MPLQPPTPIDARALFRPVAASLAELLKTLPAEDWERPTLAGTWLVRDVVAHLIDLALRRLSFDRDRMPPPPPPNPINSARDFVAFINGINAQWVASAKRLSPRVLADLYERAGRELADWIESVPADAPALFPVSWAGDASAGWIDIAREFTELWHHQQQIRIAVGAESLGDPRFLAAVIAVSVHALPPAFRDVPAESGQTVVVDVSGPGGGQWTLSRETGRWTLFRGAASPATARICLDDETAWRLLFNALPQSLAGAIRLEGDTELASAALRARSVIV